MSIIIKMILNRQITKYSDFDDKLNFTCTTVVGDQGFISETKEKRDLYSSTLWELLLWKTVHQMVRPEITFQ